MAINAYAVKSINRRAGDNMEKCKVCGCTLFKYKASKNKVGKYCAGCGKRMYWMIKFKVGEKK